MTMRRFRPITVAFLIWSGGLCSFAQNLPYLALGDSLAYGFDPFKSPPNITGYPEIISGQLSLNLANASCPGETSSSFITGVGAIPGFTCGPTAPGLFVNYGAAYSQLDYAVMYLKNNPNTKLVTINIGGNDLFPVQACVLEGMPITTCQSMVPGVLGQLAANLETIYSAIRNVYSGKIVAANYYSFDYPPVPAASIYVPVFEALNSTIATVTIVFGGNVADVFTAFQLASGAAGDPCAAGLLLEVPGAGGCDTHPSPLGQALMAATIVFPAAAAPASGANCNGIFNKTFLGNLTISAGQTCVFLGGGVTGNVVQNGGNLLLIQAHVVGDVQVNGGSVTIGPGSTIGGNLQIQSLLGGSGPNQVCATTVRGDLVFQNNLAAALIGAGPTSTAACAGNIVGGNLEVQNNSGATTVIGNTVTGNLDDHNNTGPTQVFSNVVRNNLTCQQYSLITGAGNKAKSKQGQCAAF